MEYTDNYNLAKPWYDDVSDIAVINENMSILDSVVKGISDTANEANSIAKGKNQAHVFGTMDAMQAWLSDESNMGLYQVGDNLYIIDVEVPDWWISEVLEEADAETGHYYKIEQLETQKIDLSNIDASTLGGQAPEYYATQNEVSEISTRVASNEESIAEIMQQLAQLTASDTTTEQEVEADA